MTGSTLVRRAIAMAAACLALVALANVALRHDPTWLAFAVNGAIVCAVALFERGRYRKAADPRAGWILTSERFFDPTTGAAMEVLYDPATGERAYRPR